MFEFAVGLMIYAFYFTLIFGPLTLFIMRLVYLWPMRKNKKIFYSALFLPCSIGLYYHFPTQSKFKKNYNTVSAIFFALTVIASFFIIYQIKW
ncbi:MAG: hypothetical protein LKE36_03770 [Bacilli bacterium]|jgi:hypothetical protein|nr:hypothetical protein [Bacilli bacterium]